MVWVARVFHRLLAAVFLLAWGSLALQVKLLVGARGLLPLSEYLDRAHPSFLDFPSVFLFVTPSDGVLVGLAVLGAGLGIAGMVTRFGRPLLALQLPLYLSYVVACRSFLGFQWDNLLLECALLGLFLPADRPARLAHLAFRLLVFKLYFESGVAKWQSHLRDWQDGSAMTYYYETAPLPTFLAAAAHHLPAWWHHFESRAVLVLELVLPFAIFGPRRLRFGALVVLSAFQVVNLATANYGFFCYLALLLHVFLAGEQPRVAAAARWRKAAGGILLGGYAALSTLEGVVAFADPSHGVARAAQPLRRLYAPFRVIDTYHLFGSITRERIEPDFQTSVDGEVFVGHDLHFKAGDPTRRPPFVAPHQPRVDFLLWFYGLSYRSGTPEYVGRLLERMCHDPDAVARLFTNDNDELPRAPKAVQIVFWEYHFGDDAWWTRTQRETLGPVGCDEISGRASRGAK